MWSRVISHEVGHVLQLELADRTTFIGRLERVEAGRVVLTVDGRIRVIGLDELRAIEEVEGR
jgi:ribosome maturation factor RimP